jgi:hypothetical protein
MATLVRRSLSFLFAPLLLGPALHAEGPPVDTTVVSTGAALLFGTEIFGK